jgi:hypothetical protein
MLGALSVVAAGVLEDLVDMGVVGVVDRGDADLLGQLQPIRPAVDQHHLVGALHLGRERRHQPYRPTAEDDHGVARPHPGQYGAVPADRPDVGEHRVVGLFLDGVLGQLQAVEVPERHPRQLRLAALGYPVPRAQNWRFGRDACRVGLAAPG